MNSQKKIKKSFNTLMVGLLSFIIIFIVASADSLVHTKGDNIFYSSTNYISKHYLGGEDAYCIQWTYNTIDGAVYSPFEDSAITERRRFIAGKIIEDVNNSSESEDNKIVLIDKCLNTLFGLSGSRNFSGETAVANYINNATKYVDNTEKLCTGNNTSGCFNSEKFTLNYSGNTMNQIENGSNFISNKITLTGLLSSYGGTGTSYTIKVSSSKNSNVEICQNSNGTNCSGTSVTITNPTSDHSFYVKVTGATPSSTISISATGSNVAVYPYASAYAHTSSYQALMLEDEKEVSRTLSRSATLYIPDVTKYTITATKTDEYGDNLTGASFRVYRADSSGKEIEELVKNSNGSATLSYTETEFTTSDEWYNYLYCLVETASPSGYIYGTSEKEPLCVAPVKNTTSICYNALGENTKDVEYCNTHTLECSTTQGKLSESSGKCIITSDKSTDNGGLIVIETTEATINDDHSCDGDYTYNKSTNLCEIVLTTDPSEDNTCTEEGYTFNEESGKCEKKDTKEAINEPTYSCDIERYSLEKDENGDNICVKYSCSDSNYTYVSEEKICKSTSDPTVCKRVSDNITVDSKYCSINSQEYTLVTTNSNSINFVKTNSKNSVSISKTDVTGENELSGAKMKICSTKPDSNFNCEIAYVVQKGSCSTEKAGVCTNNSDGTMNVYMQWVSDIAPRTWKGLNTDVNYYLVETIAPLGYSVSSYVQFSISKDGTVASENKVVENNHIIVKNDLTTITISKQDIATSKELPGATLKLCLVGFDEEGDLQTIVDEEGNCSIPILADGSEATWISTDTPKELTGLPAGTYYLIETITPDDYDVAEKILFTLNQDGTVTDSNGKNILNNKIIMYDKKITSPPTGSKIAIVVVLGIIGLGVGTYFYFKKTKGCT